MATLNSDDAQAEKASDAQGISAHLDPIPDHPCMAYVCLPGTSRGVQWRSLSGVGASIGDPFEGAGTLIPETTRK